MIPFYGFYILMVLFIESSPNSKKEKNISLIWPGSQKSVLLPMYTFSFFKLSMFREFQEINNNLLSGSSNSLKLKKLLKNEA